MESFWELNIFKTILVFMGAALGDVLWTFYIRRTGEGKAFSAALFSMFIVLLGAFITLKYVENAWYLIPAGIGALTGTYFTIKFDIRKRREGAQ